MPEVKKYDPSEGFVENPVITAHFEKWLKLKNQMLEIENNKNRHLPEESKQSEPQLKMLTPMPFIKQIEERAA